MITAVDTSVLLDVLLPDPTFGPASRESLRHASRQGALLICEVVYAELAGLFPKREALEAFLQEAGIQVRPSDPQTLWHAGAMWRRFCMDRSRHAVLARRIVADFLIGAHAMRQAEQLLTRDKDFYHTVFDGLRLITPS